MSRTPDRSPGVADEEGIVLEETTLSSSEGEIRYNGSRFSFYDEVGEFDPRSGGSGITESQHKNLDQLVHMLAEDAYYEVTYSGNKVTSEIWWTDISKTTKIREVLYTYIGSRVNTETWHQFNGSGVQTATLAISFTYSGNKIISAAENYSEP